MQYDPNENLGGNAVGRPRQAPLEAALPSTRPEERSFEIFKSELRKEHLFFHPYSLYRHSTGIAVLTRSLDQLDVGGKALGLIDLGTSGFPIPRTILVSRDIIPSDLADDHNVNAVFNEALPKFKPLGRALRDAAWRVGIGGIVAVRSSGAEDADTHTAAGVFASEFTQIGGQDNSFLKACVGVATSSYTGDARRFLERINVPVAPIPFIVQKLIVGNEYRSGSGVGPYLSGIADTSHPNEILIAMAPGLCTTVADGKNSLVAVARKDEDLFDLDGEVHFVALLKEDTSGNLSIRTYEAPEDGFALYDEKFARPVASIARSVSKTMREMSNSERGVVVEFAVAQNPGNSEPKAVFTQKRSVPMLEDAPQLTSKLSLKDSISTNASIGQKRVVSDWMVQVEIPENRWLDTDAILAKFTSMGVTANRENKPIFVVHFPKYAATAEDPSGRYKNFIEALAPLCSGVMIVDHSPTRFRWHMSRGGKLSHFAHFFRSEELPVVIFNSTECSDALLQWQGTATKQKLGSGLSLFTLPSPMALIADQVRNFGVVGIVKGS